MSGDGDVENTEDRPWEPDDRESEDTTAGLDLEGTNLGPDADEVPAETTPDEEQSLPIYTAAGLQKLLASTRENAQARQVRTAQAALLGLVVVTFTPAGLVLGGALVGIAQRTPTRGLLAGVAYGLVALVVFVPWLGWPGAVGVTAGEPLTIAVPVLGGLLGSLGRFV